MSIVRIIARPLLATGFVVNGVDAFRNSSRSAEHLAPVLTGVERAVPQAKSAVSNSAVVAQEPHPEDPVLPHGDPLGIPPDSLPVPTTEHGSGQNQAFVPHGPARDDLLRSGELGLSTPRDLESSAGDDRCAC